MTFPITPTQDKIIVKPADLSRVTQGGIIIPHMGEEIEVGEVVAVGPGDLNADGTRGTMFVKVGDVIRFHKSMVQDFSFAGEKYRVVRQRFCMDVQ